MFCLSGRQPTDESHPVLSTVFLAVGRGFFWRIVARLRQGFSGRVRSVIGAENVHVTYARPPKL